MKSRIPALILATLLLGGCVRIDIGGDQKPTIGKQLIDLYRARETGAISDTQFKRLQVAILEAI
jgi:hypothetical protein